MTGRYVGLRHRIEHRPAGDRNCRGCGPARGGAAVRRRIKLPTDQRASTPVASADRQVSREHAANPCRSGGHPRRTARLVSEQPSQHRSADGPDAGPLQPDGHRSRKWRAGSAVRRAAPGRWMSGRTGHGARPARSPATPTILPGANDNLTTGRVG
jgi:hypothetical protein